MKLAVLIILSCACVAYAQVGEFSTTSRLALSRNCLFPGNVRPLMTVNQLNGVECFNLCVIMKNCRSFTINTFLRTCSLFEQIFNRNQVVSARSPPDQNQVCGILSNAAIQAKKTPDRVTVPRLPPTTTLSPLGLRPLDTDRLFLDDIIG